MTLLGKGAAAADVAKLEEENFTPIFCRIIAFERLFYDFISASLFAGGTIKKFLLCVSLV